MFSGKLDFLDLFAAYLMNLSMGIADRGLNSNGEIGDEYYEVAGMPSATRWSPGAQALLVDSTTEAKWMVDLFLGVSKNRATPSHHPCQIGISH